MWEDYPKHVAEACPQLRRLAVCHVGTDPGDSAMISQQRIAPLSRLRHLGSLSLEHMVKDEGGDVLYGRISDQVMSDLSGLTQLTSLTLASEHYLGEALGYLLPLARLQSLVLDVATSDGEDDCSALAALQASLTRLEIRGQPNPPPSLLPSICQCQQLEELSLHSGVDGRELARLLQCLPRLAKLDVNSVWAGEPVELHQELLSRPLVLTLAKVPTPSKVLRLPPLYPESGIRLGNSSWSWDLALETDALERANPGWDEARVLRGGVDLIEAAVKKLAPSLLPCPSLRWHLRWEQIHDAGSRAAVAVVAALGPLAGSGLRELALHGPVLDRAAVAELSVALPQLEALELEQCDVQRGAWGAMSSLAKLRRVVVHVYGHPLAIDSLALYADEPGYALILFLSFLRPRPAPATTTTTT